MPLDNLTTVAIQWMYGIGILTHLSLMEGEFLCDFIQLASVADKYEITGLSEHSFKTACLCLNDRLDWPVDLEQFIRPVVDYKECHIVTTHTKFVLRVLAENYEKLYKQEAFCKLLVDQPKLEEGMMDFANKEKDPDDMGWIHMIVLFGRVKRNLPAKGH